MHNVFVLFLGMIVVLFTFVCVLISVAFFTLVDRKVMAAMQRRIGPNVAGPYGVFQPLVDGAKLLVHSFPVLRYAQSVPYFVSPLLSFLVSLGGFLVLPDLYVGAGWDTSYSLFFVLSFTAYALFGVVIAGWSSGSRYAFLGGMRSTAQMLAYEILLTMVVATPAVAAETLSLEGLLAAQVESGFFVFASFPAAVAFLAIMLAETNRTPFDLMEAEAEIVAGFNVEYGALVFSLFFLAEYAAMLFLSCLFVFVFLGGSFFFGVSSIWFFCVKLGVVVYFFAAVRAALPRLRFDQVLSVSWRYAVPFLFINLLMMGLGTSALAGAL